MRAAVYARKSTEQNGVAEEAKSVARQVDGARAFIAGKGWALNEAHIYTDDGVSGALFLGRPEFQRMMRDAEAEAFEHVVFFDLDRFGRNARRTMDALWELDDLGVTIWDFSTGQQMDLDSFGGRITTTLKAEFAQEEREQRSKHTRAGMCRIAERGGVTGCNTFGYDITGTKGQKEWRINDEQAAVVREIYTRYAAGDSHRSIAGILNAAKVPQPQAQRGRACGWSASTIHAVLRRPMYRGELVYGRTGAASRRQLRKQPKRSGPRREYAQVDKPEDTWIRVQNESLRIIDADLAARCDKRRLGLRHRYFASKARNDGRVPERAHGKYLLTGGMLVCPTCGGHFEALKVPWKDDGVYTCSTRRRKPGICTNTLALPMAETDAAILSTIEGDVLHPRLIEDLLLLVDHGGADDNVRLTADRDQLQREVKNLVAAIAKGVAEDTVASDIRQRQVEIAKLDEKLRTPRRVPLDVVKLRQALTLRAEDWKRDLRAEVKVARMLLRRLVGPLTLWQDEPVPAWIKWEAEFRPESLLDGLVHDMASPTGFEPVFWP
jgi:site-specific DNA recombinase